MDKRLLNTVLKLCNNPLRHGRYFLSRAPWHIADGFFTVCYSRILQALDVYIRIGRFHGIYLKHVLARCGGFCASLQHICNFCPSFLPSTPCEQSKLLKCEL